MDGHYLIVDHLFQFFANFEEGQFFGWDLDLRAGFGVPPHVGLVIFNHEAAKSSNLNAAAADDTLGDGIEKSVDDLFGIFPA